MTKMTYVNAIDAVLNDEVNDEVRERLVALRESLRSATRASPTSPLRPSARMRA